jgi:DNA repair photolyase
LELADQYRFGIAIATKGSLITRDIDILRRIREHSPVICKVTVTTTDDELSHIIEPHVGVSSGRFAAVRELSAAGIYTGILMMPLLPWLTDTPENVLSIIHTAHQCGARFIFPLFGLSMRSGQREYLYQKLNEHFPERQLTQAYSKQYGSSYWCHSPRENELKKLFVQECNKLGILYRMEDIINDYKKGYDYEQLSLFP